MYAHYLYLAECFLEWEMFQTIYGENKNIFFCCITFLSEIVPVQEITCKNIVERGRPQMTTWRMRFACWVPKTTNTLRIHNTCWFVTSTVVIRTRPIVTLYVHCLSCSVCLHSVTYPISHHIDIWNPYLGLNVVSPWRGKASVELHFRACSFVVWCLFLHKSNCLLALYVENEGLVLARVSWRKKLQDLISDQAWNLFFWRASFVMRLVSCSGRLRRNSSDMCWRI
jgi:hypothetical protein